MVVPDSPLDAPGVWAGLPALSYDGPNAVLEAVSPAVDTWVLRMSTHSCMGLLFFVGWCGLTLLCFHALAPRPPSVIPEKGKPSAV